MVRAIGVVCFVCSAAAGCATAARPRPADTKPQVSGRIVDTPDEKLAAQRGNDPNAHADDETRRWGIEEAKQRRAEQKKRAADKRDVKRADVVPPGAPPPQLPPP